jgi:hypothetical protein
MTRVTRRLGLVVVFEHNPWNPLTRKVVRNIDFDEGVELVTRNSLARSFRRVGLTPAEERYLLFTPWKALDRYERFLHWLPLGAQYVVAGRAEGR